MESQSGSLRPASCHSSSALGLLFWLVRWLAYGRLTICTHADVAISVLLLTVPVTLWATALPEVTRPQIYRLLAGVLLFYAIANWASSATRARLATNGIVAAGALLALAAPVAVQWMPGTKLLFIPEAIYRRVPLLLSDAIHPNVMAGALVVILPLASGLLLFGWGQQSVAERAISIVADILMLGVLLLTKSRGGLFGLAAAAIVLVAMRWKRGWLVVPLAVLVSGLVIWQLGSARIIEAMTSTQSLGGLEGRLEVWSRADVHASRFSFLRDRDGHVQTGSQRLVPVISRRARCRRSARA